MLDSLSELGTGKIFHGRYEIVRVIRAGGMGAVYEVVHLETKRRRALKLMLPAIVRDADMRNRFRAEAQITADVESDHIVETFDAGVDPETGAPFLVMELLRGEDLGRHLDARGRLPAPEVVGLLHQLARALDQTHARGIVHRDLKPENLFLAVRGDDPPRLKVLDFGIAKVVAQSAQTQGGTTSLGTPLYMAPEQFEGAEVSPRTDLFALGHIAFTLLVGQPYWREDAEGIGGILPLLQRLARGAKEPASKRAARRGVTLPEGFDTWFARAIAPDPADRFPRATEQIAALGEALGVARESATIPTPTLASGSGPTPVASAPTASSAPTLPVPSDPDAALAPTAPDESSPLASSPPAASLQLDTARRGESEERALAQTHHASVTSVPQISPHPARRRALLLAGLTGFVLVAAALGARRLASPATEGPPSSASLPSPEPPVAPPPASAAPAPTAPHVEAASAAPPPTAAPAPTETASAAPPRAPAVKAPRTAAPTGPAKPRRDPSKVFE